MNKSKQKVQRKVDDNCCLSGNEQNEDEIEIEIQTNSEHGKKENKIKKKTIRLERVKEVENGIKSTCKKNQKVQNEKKRRKEMKNRSSGEMCQR